MTEKCPTCDRVIPGEFTPEEIKDLNVVLSGYPEELHRLLKQFCNRSRFDREAMGAIELAFLIGSQHPRPIDG